MIKNYSFSKDFYCLLTTLSIVFFIYSLSLFRPWQPFDERLIYNETLFPIPTSFEETFEVIKTFVLNAHLESMNVYFSNHMTVRSDPVAWTILVFIFYLFKKNALLYHLFQLIIHLINTTLVWLILNKTTKIIEDKETQLSNNFNKYKHFLISLFTLCWALHSTNCEAVLLVTNWNALLTYTFSFSFLLYEITNIVNKNFKGSFLNYLIIVLLFTFSMFITEYGYTIPIILFFLNFSLAEYKHRALKKNIEISIKRILPYLSGLLVFLFLSALKTNSGLNNFFRKIYIFFF